MPLSTSRGNFGVKNETQGRVFVITRAAQGLGHMDLVFGSDLEPSTTDRRILGNLAHASFTQYRIAMPLPQDNLRAAAFRAGI